MLKDGKCVIRNPRDGYKVSTLISGDVFGEDEALRVTGYNHFGDIYTSEESMFWFISRENMERIPEYDLQKMRRNCKRNDSRLQQLAARCEERYGTAVG